MDETFANLIPSAIGARLAPSFSRPVPNETYSRTDTLKATWLGALVFALAFAAPKPGETQVAQAGAEVSNVVIWRTLRNDFHDNNLSADFVNEVVTKTPPAFITIGKGETVSGNLQKSLNISSTWTPTLYRQMILRIAELNSDIPDINKVPAGTQLLVPQVPTVGQKIKPTFAKGWLGRNLKTGFGWLKEAVADTAFLNEASEGVAPQQEVQFFTIPASQLALYKLAGNVPQGASGPVVVQLAQGPANAAPKSVLTLPLATLIKSKLAAAGAGPRPILVVVDDSIPDNGEYAKARQFVIDASRLIRQTYALGDSPFLAELEAMPTSMIAESPASMFPNLTTHASLIKQSLQEFLNLDPSGRVNVVYLPLGATQVGVAPLIKEILYLAQIIKVVRPPLPPVLTTSAYQRDRAKEVTAQIISTNPAAYSAGVLMPLDSGDLSVTTDSLYLEAIGIVLAYYADAARRPYVLSFSWSAQKFTYPTLFDAGTYGLKFAAAGNQRKSMPGLDFLSLEIEYASRAATSQDFVAVMNSTGTPATCPSNFYDDTGLSVASLAYPGEVTGQYCGTSFSTPRAAWLAAARDASIGKTLALPVSKQGKLAWLKSQHDAILALKQASQTDIFGRYSLDVTKYFGN